MRRLTLRATALLGAVALVATLFTATQATTAPVPAASAASGSDFDAGMIISDSVFYNSGTMTVDQIQSFLNARVPSCRAGYTCLRNYFETTHYQSAKAEGCAAYAGQYESAARIIYKVATACGINPEVLIVLLEKEQGLVSDDWPTARQYRSATGYGCPDTADCDANYYGFFNQLYNAAWQFKKYRANPGIRNYQAGRWNTILWNPNGACGSSQVYIQNQATAGLYVYTPYRPNQAALNNLYGTGDGCSSYGNRNFWRMFTDWFGSTAITVPAVLQSAWIAQGGATGGRLGAPTSSAVSLPGGGLMQSFKGGWLIWRSDLGAFRTTGALGAYYFKIGGPGGGLGYPINDIAGADAIEHVQDFEFGHLSWKPSGTTTLLGGYRVDGSFGTNWRALGGATGKLGYPAGDDYTEASGWTAQKFDKGRLLYSVAGRIMYWLPNGIWDYWKSKGGLAGVFGAPVASPTGSDAAGWTQDFTTARLTWKPAGGASTVVGGFAVSGVWATNWNALKSRSGVLGFPTGAVTDEGSGWSSQAFERGRLLYDGKVMYWVPKGIWDAWKAKGGLKGAFGAPSASPVGSEANGWKQDFANGRFAWTAAAGASSVGGFGVSSVWATNWNALKGPSGVLGYPMGAVVNEGSGWSSQAFEQGRLLYDSSRNIMYWVPNGIWDAWKAKGGLTGAFGSPVASPVGSATAGWKQDFTGGRFTWTPSGGASSAGGFAVSGVWATNWNALKDRNGVLGFPMGAVVDEGSGWSSQAFERGRLLYDSGRQIMYWVQNGIWDYWKSKGGPTGAFGGPVASPKGSDAAGWTQDFVLGRLAYSATAGASTLIGGAPVTDVWATNWNALKARDGVLGYPIGFVLDEGSGWSAQRYERGRLLYDGTAKVMYWVPNAIWDYWKAAGGYTGKLGKPSASPTVYSSDGWSQRFAGGTVVWTPGTGARAG